MTGQHLETDVLVAIGFKFFYHLDDASDYSFAVRRHTLSEILQDLAHLLCSFACSQCFESRIVRNVHVFFGHDGLVSL